MITLTTDFGDSPYLGAMRGAILAVHPEARLVDVTHSVPKHDVRAGAFALLSALPHFPSGAVHVAVVDPGVGSDRRGLLLRCRGGYLVGPDNGLLVPVAQRLGLVEARVLENAAWWAEDVSSTFHGRDVFGPVAARLDRGLAPEEVGPRLPEGALAACDLGTPRQEGEALLGEVVLVDGFGNCVTNIPAGLARARLVPGDRVRVRWAGGEVEALKVRTYAEAGQGQAVVLVGSHGFLEVAAAEASFAEGSGLEAGMEVRVEAA